MCPLHTSHCVAIVCCHIFFIKIDQRTVVNENLLRTSRPFQDNHYSCQFAPPLWGQDSSTKGVLITFKVRTNYNRRFRCLYMYLFFYFIQIGITQTAVWKMSIFFAVAGGARWGSWLLSWILQTFEFVLLSLISRNKTHRNLKWCRARSEPRSKKKSTLRTSRANRTTTNRHELRSVV